MGYDPKEPRDNSGKWSSGGGGGSNRDMRQHGASGRNQTLKNSHAALAKEGSVEARKKAFETAKRTEHERIGRMNNTQRAQLTSRATFNTKFSAGKASGSKPAKVIGDERLVSHYTSNTVEKKKGKGSFQQHSNTSISKEVRSTPKELNLFARTDSPAAVAIKTAQSLNKDFHAARDKANKDAMHAALAKSSAPVTKYPAGPKPKYGPKGKMK